MENLVKYLFLLHILRPTDSSDSINEYNLPTDPIFFQKSITDHRQFEDFLLSNANIGRADIQVCLHIYAPPKKTEALNELRSNPRSENTDLGTTAEDVFVSAWTPHGVQENPSWVVGNCNNNYSLETAIQEVTAAKKFLILRVVEMFDIAWPYLHNLVKKKKFILINWPIIMGPGSDSAYMKVVQVPADLSGVQGVLLSYREGTSMQDHEDDRYWYYHYEQMAAAIESTPLVQIPVKLVAFNGLYLTRSSASDISNCTRATGFFHYLNDKDTVRLNSRAYKRRIEAYSMIHRYNIWAISEFISPDFNTGGKRWKTRVLMDGMGVLFIILIGNIRYLDETLFI